MSKQESLPLEVHKIRDLNNRLNYSMKKSNFRRNDLIELRNFVSSLEQTESRFKKENQDLGPKNQLLAQEFRKVLHSFGIRSGKVAEIGGPKNTIAKELPEYEFEYLSLYPESDNPNVIVTDICQADNIPDNRYDAIFSSAVLEHVAKPWNAAKHLVRILKPNGIMYHSAPFSYFYHGAPNDYWRYTPDAFELLFAELRCIDVTFNSSKRRLDNRGKETYPVDRDGGEKFAIDGFGGWRETWFTHYVGQKDSEHLTNKWNVAKSQAIVNLARARQIQKSSYFKAFIDVALICKRLYVHPDGDIELVSPKNSNIKFFPSIKTALNTLIENKSIKTSSDCYAMAAKVGWH